MNPTWTWDLPFVGDIVSLACLGVAAGTFAHVIYTRNRHGRFDRLVWGLLGFFNAIFLLSVINILIATGFVPNHDAIKWPLRIIAAVFGLNGAWAAKKAEPLVYLSDLRLLNQRILNKRAVINQQDHDLVVLQKKVDKYERVFGPLPD